MEIDSNAYEFDDFVDTSDRIGVHTALLASCGARQPSPWRGFQSTLGVICPAVAVLTVGVLAAGTGFADTTIDKSRTKETPEGWEISIAKTEENLDRWPTLNAAAFPRRSIILRSGECLDRWSRPRPGALRCDLNGVDDRLRYRCLARSHHLGTLGTGTVSQYPADTAGLNGGLNVEISPMVQVTLRPGTITTVALASKAMAATTADWQSRG